MAIFDSTPKYPAEQVKSWEWERDAVNRLYYGLWVVFLGGFVLSLRVPVRWCFCATTILMVAFRVLAIAGTALNFLMQERALTALSHFRFGMVCESEGDPTLAAEKYSEAAELNRIVIQFDNWLKGVGFLFLLLALISSFVVKIASGS